MNAIYYETYKSPVGNLLLLSNGDALSGLYLKPPQRESHWRRDAAPFKKVQEQLTAYFANELTEFDLPLAPKGTEFQQKVWTALLTIPFGELASYRDIAHQIGSPKAVRAVGAANGKNPISIIVPCHRVVGSNGKLTGYSGGLKNKEWLLAHEKNNARP